jgi:hypothetical protein
MFRRQVRSKVGANLKKISYQGSFNRSAQAGNINKGGMKVKRAVIIIEKTAIQEIFSGLSLFKISFCYK